MSTRTRSDRRADSTAATTDQHAVPRSVLLHLLPGVMGAAVFYACAPAVMRAGYPAIAAGVLAAVVLVGVQLGWLLLESRRLAASPRATGGVLPYRPGPFTARKVLVVVALFCWAFAVSVLGIGRSIKDSFFTWMPEWVLEPLPASFAATGSQTAQIVTGLGYLLLLVVLAPTVEEVYFRGYLLPRIDRFGALAVLVNVGLFATYHLWKPWDVINLIIILGPMVYAVWRLRDIRIGIAVHVALNGLGWALNVAPTLLLD